MCRSEPFRRAVSVCLFQISDRFSIRRHSFPHSPRGMSRLRFSFHLKKRRSTRRIPRTQRLRFHPAAQHPFRLSARFSILPCAGSSKNRFRCTSASAQHVQRRFSVHNPERFLRFSRPRRAAIPSPLPALRR